MTFWETIERGEYVMFALAVFLILIICIWWARAARLSREKKGYGSLMHRMRDYVTEGDLENARHLCEVSPSAGGRVLSAGVENIGSRMADVKASMREVAELEKGNMGKGVIWLRFFAVISPLTGLCGTLVGMIDRLRDLGDGAVPVDTAAVCSALAPTIVTTVAGLGVGVFSLFALACLESAVTSAKRAIDNLSLEFSNLLQSPA